MTEVHKYSGLVSISKNTWKGDKNLKTLLICIKHWLYSIKGTSYHQALVVIVFINVLHIDLLLMKNKRIKYLATLIVVTWNPNLKSLKNKTLVPKWIILHATPSGTNNKVKCWSHTQNSSPLQWVQHWYTDSRLVFQIW